MRKNCISKVFWLVTLASLFFCPMIIKAQKTITISKESGSQTVTFQNPNLDLSKKAYIALDVNNASSAELFIEWFYKGPWAMHQIDAADLVSSNQNVQIKKIFYRKNIDSSSPWYPAFGTRATQGLPGNHVMHWRAFDYKDLKQVTVTVSLKNYKGAAGTVTISQPYVIGDYTFPEIDYNALSKPLIDEMGQYVHDTWDMKLSNISDLKPLAEEDIKKYVGASFSPALSGFGGITGAERYDSTGYFHSQKINGKWWFIDPDGYMFWSLGVDDAGLGSGTTVNGREDIFPSFSDDKGTGLWKILEPQTRDNTFYFYNMNLIRKYGEQWETKRQEVNYGRMKTWGLNTAGAWSDYPDKVKHPYTFWVWYPFEGYFVNDNGKAAKMTDPFSGTAKQNIINNLKSALQNKASDPWLVGVFVQNELDWEDEMNVPEMVLKMKNDKPARMEMENLLKNKYSTIQNLNAAWGSSFNSFANVAVGEYNAAFKSDMIAYLAHFAETHFSFIAQEVKKLLPNHMYIGERFKANSFGNTTVLNTAARYCDVVSFNAYRWALDDFEVQLETDKPWLIGEFNFSTSSHGVWGGGSASDLNNAAELCRNYIKSGLRHPNFVGVHWFQWADQMTTGRKNNDGENSRIGLINITDQPYVEMIDAIKECSEKIYELRTGEPLATGLKDFNIKKSLQVKIYPNPSDGDFYVKTNNLNQTCLSIFTITGQKVYETRFQGSKNILLPESVRGIFLVKVENAGEKNIQRILIY